MQKFIDLFRKILPDQTWFIMYGVITLCITVAYNIPAILFATGLSSDKSGLLYDINRTTQNFVNGLDGLQYTAFVVTFIFWGAIGLLMFLIIQVILRSTTELYKEKVFITKYAHPVSYSLKDYISHFFLSGLELIAIIVILALTLIVSVTLFFTSLATSSREFVSHMSMLEGIKILLWFMAFWLSIYIIHMLLNLLAHRKTLI